MAAASYRSGSERRRATSLTLAILAHLLLLMILWHLSPPIADFQPRPRTSTFSMLPDRGEEPAAAPKKRAVARPRAASRGAPPRPVKPLPTPPTPTPPIVIPNKAAPLPFIEMTHDQLAAADIARLPSHKGEGSSEGEGRTGDADNGDSAAASGPGDGPGGQHLYAAAWQTEPTDAQLAFYLPKEVRPGSWAIIACQTVERYRVENCRALGDSPVGSGLARGIVNAAWQFKVLPPRIGGKAMVGAWVRIRIDFTERGATVTRR